MHYLGQNQKRILQGPTYTKKLPFIWNSSFTMCPAYLSSKSSTLLGTHPYRILARVSLMGWCPSCTTYYVLWISSLKTTIIKLFFLFSLLFCYWTFTKYHHPLKRNQIKLPSMWSPLSCNHADDNLYWGKGDLFYNIGTVIQQNLVK